MVEIITREDLQLFRMQLLDDIRQLLQRDAAPSMKTKWLRSKEVRQLLNISAGTLLNLRLHGKLTSSKVGRLHYYKLEEIEKLLK